MKKNLLLFSLLFLQKILFAQQATVLQLTTLEGDPIPYARVILPQATVYTSEIGEVNLSLAVGDSFSITAFGFADTTMLYNKEADYLTLTLWPKPDTLRAVNLSSNKSEPIKVGGKIKLLQREPSEIRLVQVSTKNRFIDSLRVLVHETFMDGAALRAVVYDGTEEFLLGPVVPIPNGFKGVVTLPISRWVGGKDSLLVGLEFINTNYLNPKHRRPGTFSSRSNGIFTPNSNGITLKATKKTNKNQLWVYVYYLNGKLQITDKAHYGKFFAAPYMEIYFTPGQ